MIATMGVGTAELATIGGTLLAAGVLVFKAGRWKGEIQTDHEKQSEAHKMVHRDVEKILEQMDANIHSNRQDCPTCSDD